MDKIYAIKNIKTGELDTTTLGCCDEECWNKALGFHATDDQWWYRRQKAEERGYLCVEVKLVEVK